MRIAQFDHFRPSAAVWALLIPPAKAGGLVIRSESPETINLCINIIQKLFNTHDSVLFRKERALKDSLKQKPKDYHN